MKIISAAIFIKDCFVLIAQRGKNENLSGYWEFPGGKQEGNEDIFECTKREIFEEFIVKCKAKKIFCESIYDYEPGLIKLIAVLTDLLDERIILKVHEDFRWVKIDELLNYNLAPADIPIAKKNIEVYK
ncbi:NUDIX domain-containing protein [Brucepastera parasyntrophica]|uniref:(deoxy)nucleoside triphosphate pyrophosphohydrolase n=1 Tax=Brucepastera parasyntrophica TaxID=2880008 RepID=UPI00210A9D1C|nr:NUDIX domain-containing protein [Brucepastera parasyntrophica]ULQ60283.1 NUDIX domain-containing protein [Brucepastera parasyntrophica]